ncbi:MAG: ABC transporter permease subunit [Acidimicrobiaceae bacterium]|nr:ABC transporter permease subunit [Acidimicrobiaceae bacterium]MBT5581762.1 ABC transporter permease subunit [Acidimicrobiaceae bacterium]MBT5849222.1 ABC transporter permease subunit [Acidimicrobiaceae bacterium]
MSWHRTFTVARTDIRQLVLAKDFWMPMSILGSIFFVVVPLVLLFSIASLGDVDAVQNIADTLEVLPAKAQAQIKGDTPQGRTSYALAVFLFAPMAVVVPLTISTAVGAATLVGERERGTGEFLAHSPAATKEIYLGKLMASLVPGYLTTMVGFTLYSLIVNLIVGPEVGGWFFPTQQWWLLMLWVLPGFLLIGLSLVLRLSGRVKSTAAAQQASGLITLPLIAVSYAQASGAIYGTITTTIMIGAIAWFIGLVSTSRGMSGIRRQRLLGVADGV